MAQIELKSPAQLADMRHGGRLVAGVLALVAGIAEPGVTTEQLDRAAEDYIAGQGARASFKGYNGFPASICTSINEEIVHGIPGPRRLREGDLLKVDVGVLWRGHHTDAAITIPVGEVCDAARRLMQATRAALHAGIAAIRGATPVSAISAAVQQVAEADGFRVVRDYTGHGIGRALHEPPRVPNFVGVRWMAEDPILSPGAVVAIEPMVNAGTARTEVLGDGWTVVTRDRKLSAHFEHTVGVEEQGAVILTLP